jgi:hypothetical protein
MGFNVGDEICLNHIYYYPKTLKFTECSSQTSINEIINFYKSLMKYKRFKIYNFN